MGEYIILCAVRIGALEPRLIEIIADRFTELDVSGDGLLEYAEILEDSSLLQLKDAATIEDQAPNKSVSTSMEEKLNFADSAEKRN